MKITINEFNEYVCDNCGHIANYKDNGICSNCELEKRNKMKMYPVELEIYDENEDICCTLKAIDEYSLTIKIDDKVLNAEELHEIADLLEIAQKQLENGIQINKQKD